jgi:hypothetical protein
MESRHIRGSNLTVGLILIVLGVFFAVTQGAIPSPWFNLNWEVGWPMMMILLGGAIFAGAFSRVGQARAAAATFGSVVILIGAFFLATTLGFVSWEDQGRLWPIYPLSVGVGLLIGYLLSGLDLRNYLIGGLIVGFVSLILLTVTLTNTYLYLSQIWPMALILMGVLLIVMRPTQTRPRC